jgi:prepilin-type N-terminal cleavage/methylation domain-containing protein
VIIERVKRGFSLLEVITVILIVGIIGGGSVQIVANIYSAYSEKSTLNRADSSSLNGIHQVSRLIENRIEGSSIISKSGTFSELNESEASGKDGFLLEWVGSDYDGFLGAWNSDYGAVLPMWNGFIDLEKEHNSSTIVLGSENDLDTLQISIKNLSNGSVDINSSSNPVALFFKTGNYNNAMDGFGWYGSDSFGAYRVYNSGDNNWTSVDTNFSSSREKAIIYEQYQLSWSAYSLELKQDSSVTDRTVYHLNLNYNYRPWNGDTYSDGNSNRLLSGVSNLTFRKIGSTVHLVLCIDTEYPNRIDDSGEFSELCRRVVIY